MVVFSNFEDSFFLLVFVVNESYAGGGVVVVGLVVLVAMCACVSLFFLFLSLSLSLSLSLFIVVLSLLGGYTCREFLVEVESV